MRPSFMAGWENGLPVRHDVSLPFLWAFGDIACGHLRPQLLRTHPAVAHAYAKVKRQAAEDCPETQSYQDAKRAFVDELRQAARRWAQEQDRHLTVYGPARLLFARRSAADAVSRCDGA